MSYDVLPDALRKRLEESRSTVDKQYLSIVEAFEHHFKFLRTSISDYIILANELERLYGEIKECITFITNSQNRASIGTKTTHITVLIPRLLALHHELETFYVDKYVSRRLTDV